MDGQKIPTGKHLNTTMTRLGLAVFGFDGENGIELMVKTASS
jgi:hypothetical protein